MYRAIKPAESKLDISIREEERNVSISRIVNLCHDPFAQGVWAVLVVMASGTIGFHSCCTVQCNV